MNNTIPPEIKKWIEDEAEKFYLSSNGYDNQESFVIGATSLYKHLQENGRVAELEDQLKKSLDLYNKQTKTILKLEKELEELRSDYRLNL